MFVCGPTVQAEIHLGNARTYIFFDALARYLRHFRFEVFFLMNVTDVDEQVSRAAARVGEDPIVYSEKMTCSMMDSFRELKIDTVSHFEPVSKHVDGAIGQVASLLSGGFAYEAGGWVYFDIAKFPRFGRLSHQSQLDLSLRPLELSPHKKNLNDFSLWRPEVLLEGRWRSPWGLGSPGWHIQDTAVTIPILGPQYDLHGGAYELVYPHHEAEIAQAESLTGRRPFVRHWVHTNLLKAGGLKMSKSLGNTLTVKDALRTWSADELRFAFLSVHYRTECDMTGLGSAKRRLHRMRRMAAETGAADGEDEAAMAKFEQILNDDFDSPGVIDWAERTLRSAQKMTDHWTARRLVAATVQSMRVLGVELLEGA